TARSERLVALHEHHAWADPLELDDAAATAAAGSAIETDVVRTEAGREAAAEQELGIEPRDLQQHSAGTLIPVEREIAVEFLQARGAIFDGLRRGRTLLLLRRDDRSREQETTDEQY